MNEVLISAAEACEAVIPVQLVRADELEAWLNRRGDRAAAVLARAKGFKAAVGERMTVRGRDGSLQRVVFGLGGGGGDPMALRALAAKLPAGDYRLEGLSRRMSTPQATALTIGFALGAYVFDRYRASSRPRPRLVAPERADLAVARRLAHACALARDMINTPASDMGPLQIETIAREIAEAYGAQLTVVAGDALLDAGYPAVHAVGRAAAPHRAPRMIELAWGEEGPLIAICGKGVVFDTGGLDLKSSAGMRLMKKDMGGAAHALALARMIMDARLKLRLAVLIPAVENAVSGDAMRPGDILKTRKGLTVEVGNTDAEGRLILADALARAAELGPDLTIDLATLTGAARVALGPQVVPFYSRDSKDAATLAAAADLVGDPLWRMPLWPGYETAIESDIADLRNDPDGWAQAGSVTAALFLQRFAPPGPWMHFDIFAWNPKSRPGWPAGAEAQAVRALFHWLSDRYA